MENFMNEPVEYNWTENDIIKEFQKYGAAGNGNFEKECII